MPNTSILGMLFLLIRIQCGAAEGTVPRDGFDLHYRTSGSGTPAILLSGGPGLDVDYMTGVAEQLPPAYLRVLLEQRGAGRSRPPKLSRENITLPLMIDDLEALRVHLKQDRLLLVGHSWGAMVAMAYAGKYLQRVDRLLLIGPGGMTSEFFMVAGDNIRSRLYPEDLEAQRRWSPANQPGIDADKVSLEALRAITPAYFFDRQGSRLRGPTEGGNDARRHESVYGGGSGQDVRSARVPAGVPAAVSNRPGPSRPGSGVHGGGDTQGAQVLNA